MENIFIHESLIPELQAFAPFSRNAKPRIR